MNGIMSLVTVFIAISIMLGIGVMILGETSGSINCRDLEGATAAVTTAGTIPGFVAGTTYVNLETGDTITTASATNAPVGSVFAPVDSWAGTCADIQAQSQDGFNLHAYASIMATTILLAAGVMAMQGICNHPDRCCRSRHSDYCQNALAAAPKTQ